jgi:hypothetical protein
MLINWVSALSQLTEKQGWHWTTDGKIKMNIVSQVYNTPWLYAPTRIPGVKEEGFDCGILTILHNQVFLGKAAPSFCMECYKVVVMPETLEQVHKMADWQQGECTEKEWPCKVGAERRNYTQRKWGAYFYCRGVEEGRERYKAVREWVDNNLGSHINVILKRACTEFEQHMGDSDKWKKISQQDEIEAEAKEVFDYTPSEKLQGDCVQHHVYDVWEAWDEDNQPPVTYHETEE